MIRWRLREIMARKRMSNNELAEKLQINRVSVSRLKNSETMPRIDGQTLEKICKALDVTPADLLELEKEESHSDPT
ncbi:helix-turn-helix transcriptional regulator (plasmid) [Euhalothece natronophila Z-M001]|uniref:Helix-turn-helix transcriptional regulator n=1 Tax=Euhalothece natronophila Z-M001 TaxID=522448 RepID=A0A5B8NTC3_9CHRO|nr:helix-turn-helix transcriptional regulator [Euhalothece natronophila]QDZ41585.1 helix-turn-helix transcriptional regulator [Euhalothece natronophila Z-M001]